MRADFSKIINESITITKNNRKLWVLGLVVAALSGGSFGGGGGGGDSFQDIVNKNKNIQPNGQMERQLPSEENEQNLLNSNLLSADLPQVLGTATGSLSTLVSTIPVSFYVALLMMIFLAISISVAIGLYAQAWSQSSLIHGIDRQHAGESLGLYQMSDHGKKRVTEVIKIRIIPGLIFFLAILGTGIGLVILSAALWNTAQWAVVLLGFLWLVSLIVSAVIISAAVSLGVLAINLELLNWKDAYKRGLQLFKSYFIDMFIMSAINCLAGCTVGIVTLIVLAILGVVGMVSAIGVTVFPPFLVAAAPIIFLAILAFLMFSGLAGAIAAVFTQSTWVLLYRQLTEVPGGQ